MPPERLQHILDRWAYINQQEGSPIHPPPPVLQRRAPPPTGSPAGAGGRGEDRVSCGKMFAAWGYQRGAGDSSLR